MDAPLIDRAVAEVAQADPVFAAVLAGEGDAGGQRNMAADDRMPAEKSLLGVEKMHRPALALGAAGHLAQELGHSLLRGHPPRQAMTMVAVRRDDVIVLTQHADRADRHRLLAAVLVKKTADLVPLLIEHLRPFLEAADQHHLAEPDQGLRAVDDRFGFGLNLHHNHPTPDRMRDWADGMNSSRGITLV